MGWAEGRWIKKAKKSMWLKEAELAFKFLSMVLSEPQHNSWPKTLRPGSLPQYRCA